jgi:class 3 adenylate cyclase
LDLTEFERHGLYDPSLEDADERAALLTFLSQQGISLEEMVTAAEENRLPFVLGDRMISPGPAELSVDDVAVRMGATPDLVERLWRALGFVVQASGDQFSEADVRVLQMVQVMAHYFGEPQAVQLARTIGSSMARIAEAGFTLSIANVDDGFLPRAESHVAAAQASALLGVMVEASPAIFDVVFRHHIEATVRRWDRSLPEDPSTVRLAVGFADLVGFTSLTRDFTAPDMAAAVTDLESMAVDATAAAGGRLVKLIGDEIMFVAPDASSGCEIALALLESAAEHPVLPSLRASLAVGLLIPFEGDYYGPVVNLASRLTDVAPDGELLVTSQVVVDLDAEQFISADEQRLTVKGFPEAIGVTTVRRAASD